MITYGGWYITPTDDPPFFFEGTMDEHHALREKYVYGKIKGFFATEEDAQARRWLDEVPEYWEWNMAVWAQHCLGCGKWAKVLAGSDEGGGWAWRVTECKKCGILDSRTA